MPFNCIWPGHQRPISQTETAYVLSFSMSEKSDIEITAERGFNDVVIRPLSAGIIPEANGRKLRFKIESAGQYSVELDGMHNPLIIFANPETEFGVSDKDKDVIYFGKGVHEVGLIELCDGQTLYIDEDAVVYGYVRAVRAKDIRILGYGVLDGSRAVRTDQTLLVPQDITRRNPETDVFTPFLSQYPVADVLNTVAGTNILDEEKDFPAYLKRLNMLESCMQIYGCENVEINGITMRDSAGFTCIIANSENVIIDSVKLVGMWRYNSDGIDFFNSKNCVLKNSFLRNFDDCVVLKGIIGWDTWSMENILIEKCVLWCDWGRALEIGAETAAPEYKNIIFRDCDVIHASAVALEIHHHDRAYIHDVLYDNIRIEYSKYDAQEVYQSSEDMEYTWSHGVPLVAVITIPKGRGYSNDYIKGNVRNIRYNNIQILTDNELEIPSICLYGLDSEHTVEKISFSNISINGKHYPMEKGLDKNNFVSEVITDEAN